MTGLIVGAGGTTAKLKSMGGNFIDYRYDKLPGLPAETKFSAYSTGTVYSLTNTSAAIDFGTTDPSIIITSPGTYRIFGIVDVKYTGATFAANQTVTGQLRRTNNTDADLPGGAGTLTTDIVTTVTGTLGTISLDVIYTTANSDDAITIYGDVGTEPSVGTLTVVRANILAIKQY
jgi:hypothetical protein